MSSESSKRPIQPDGVLAEATAAASRGADAAKRLDAFFARFYDAVAGPADAEPPAPLGICRACREPISRRAAACPHCGEPWMGRKLWTGFFGTLMTAVSIVGIIISLLVAMSADVESMRAGSTIAGHPSQTPMLCAIFFACLLIAARLPAEIK